MINSSTLKRFDHGPIVPCSSTFTAANGTPVPFQGQTHVVLKVRLKDAPNGAKTGVFKIPMMVGETPYNIISTLSLAKCGWQVILDESVVAKHLKTLVTMSDTTFWCDTPWLKVLPHFGKELLMNSTMEENPEEDVPLIGHVSGVKCNRDDLEAHRAKGHAPFHPDCEHCLKSKGTVQHRRRSDRGDLSVEVLADFMYLSSVGENIDVQDERSQDQSIKVLVLREAFSSSIGAIVMTESIVKDRSLLVKWLQEFGLESSSTSLTLVTDAEEAVRSFMTNASDKFTFLVRKASPQGHESLGGAERTVRVLKESLGALQSDYLKQGFALTFERGTLQLILNYLSMSHNCHSKAFGSERSPREISVGRRLPAQTFSLFGSKVLAEIPESIKKLNPNLTRFIDATFLHPAFSSMGTLVFGYVRIGQELVPKAFIAKAIKLCFPLEIQLNSNMFNVVKVKGELGPDVEPEESQPIPRILPSSQDVSLQAPASGPPKEFFERYDFSEDCSACKSMKETGVRKGSHSKACCKRYEDWLKTQVSPVEIDDSMVDPQVVRAVDEALKVPDGVDGEYAPSLAPETPATLEMDEDDAVGDMDVDGDDDVRLVGEWPRSGQGSEGSEPPGVSLSPSPSPAEVVPSVFTRRCPACEAGCEVGVDVPGCRHNKLCRSRNQVSQVSVPQVRFEEGGTRHPIRCPRSIF